MGRANRLSSDSICCFCSEQKGRQASTPSATISAHLSMSAKDTRCFLEVIYPRVTCLIRLRYTDRCITEEKKVKIDSSPKYCSYSPLITTDRYSDKEEWDRRTYNRTRGVAVNNPTPVKQLNVPCIPVPLHIKIIKMCHMKKLLGNSFLTHFTRQEHKPDAKPCKPWYYFVSDSFMSIGQL